VTGQRQTTHAHLQLPTHTPPRSAPDDAHPTPSGSCALASRRAAVCRALDTVQRLPLSQRSQPRGALQEPRTATNPLTSLPLSPVRLHPCAGPCSRPSASAGDSIDVRQDAVPLVGATSGSGRRVTSRRKTATGATELTAARYGFGQRRAGGRMLRVRTTAYIRGRGRPGA